MMKKIYLVIIYVIFLQLLFSCSFGWSEFFYRPDAVNSRTKSIADFDINGLAPDTGDSDCFSVLVVTDVHFGTSDDNLPEKLLQWAGVKKTSLAAEGYPLKFSICLGDVTSSGASSEYDDYADFCIKMKSDLDVQMYTIPGNHDLYNSGWSKWESKVFPNKGAYRFTTSSSSGKKMSWYFIDTANGTLGNPQINDLKAKMKADRNRKLVFSHYPIYGDGHWYYILQNVNERDTLINLFAKNDVVGIFSGHAHYEKRCQFGNYFFEKTLNAFKRTGTVAVVKVDVAHGTCDYDCYDLK